MERLRICISMSNDFVPWTLISQQSDAAKDIVFSGFQLYTLEKSSTAIVSVYFILNSFLEKEECKG